MSLDEARAKAVTKAFTDRVRSKQSSLAFAQGRCREQAPVRLDALRKIETQIIEAETKAETKFVKVLDVILPPREMQQLIRLIVARKPYEFGKVLLLREYLQMQVEQVEKFEALPRLFLEQAFKQKRVIGVAKADPKLEASAKAALIAARNTLTKEQFEIYASALGMIPKNVSLEEHLKKCTKEQRSELQAYGVCKRLWMNLGCSSRQLSGSLDISPQKSTLASKMLSGGLLFAILHAVTKNF